MERITLLENLQKQFVKLLIMITEELFMIKQNMLER